MLVTEADPVRSYAAERLYALVSKTVVGVKRLPGVRILPSPLEAPCSGRSSRLDPRAVKRRAEPASVVPAVVDAAVARRRRRPTEEVNGRGIGWVSSFGQSGWGQRYVSPQGTGLFPELLASQTPHAPASAGTLHAAAVHDLGYEVASPEHGLLATAC